MRKITAATALLATSIAVSGFAADKAAAQGYERSEGGYDGSTYGQQQDRFGSSGGDRYWRERYERGYRMGREDERRASMMRDGGRSSFGQGTSGGTGGQSMSSADDQGLLFLLIERDRQQQAMRDIRQSLQEARTALQQGDQGRARTALDQAEQALRQADALQNRRQIDRSLIQAEQALQRGDRQGVQQALQQARQAMRSGGSDMQGGPGIQGGSGTQDSGGTQGGGSAQGSAQQPSSATGGGQAQPAGASSGGTQADGGSSQPTR